jgi:hypothetical protein
MDQQQSDAVATLSDIYRLVLERAQKQRELDAIDRAISLAVGIDGEDRPKKPQLSRNDFRTLCRSNHHERLPTKKRHELKGARTR